MFIDQQDGVKYFVVDENTLGFVSPQDPSTFQVLASKPTEGSNYDCLNQYAVPMHGRGMRPAGRADFDRFRVSAHGHLT